MVAQGSGRLYGSQARYNGRGASTTFTAEDVEAVEPETGRQDKYQFLRSVMAPEFATLPTEQLEALMESQYGQNAAEQYDEYLESIFGDVGRFVSHAAGDVGKFAARAAPVVANIGGGVIKGATTGASLGLPGIIGGAVAGGVGQGFASYGSGTLRDIGKGINSGIGVAGQFTGTGRIGSAIGNAVSGIGQGKNVLNSALGAATSLAGGAMGGGALGSGALGQIAGLAGGQRGGAAQTLGGLLGGRGGGLGGAMGSIAGLVGGQGNAAGIAGALSGLLGGQGGSAASQLLGLLQRPEVLQSLGAMSMGRNGRTTVPVGSAQTPVPTSAFANLLGLLANRAADEQAELSDGSERDMRYLTDDAGEWEADPAESEQRAAHLYYLLNAAEYERMLNAELQMQQLQQMQNEMQQRQMQQQAQYRDRIRQARLTQSQVDQETSFYDAMDMAELYTLNQGTGEFGELDELDELDEGVWDELDEAQYDDNDEYEYSYA